MTPELSKGDFVYQSDQELFLVVTGETDNSYTFAVHGWREIDKERLDEYVSHNNGKLHKQKAVEKVIDEDATQSERESFEKMVEMFSTYEDAELGEDGPHRDFLMEDVE